MTEPVGVPGYLPPQPAFAVCSCGILVVPRVWHHKTGWRELPQPVTPVLGEVHQCGGDERKFEHD